MKVMDDFYDAWDAAVVAAFLYDHADILLQISEYFDRFVGTRLELRRDVRNFTVYLRRLEHQFDDEYAQYKLLKRQVSSGTFSSNLLPKLAYDVIELVERPLSYLRKEKSK
jgi:hypothetical protein